jgi:DNA-directed RNA polymerase subunit alpha
LKGNTDTIISPILGRLKVQGPAIITAGLISFSEVTVINKSHYIATISDNSFLEIEFKVEKGKNYLLLDSSDERNNPKDFLLIDSIFMPIRKVNYSIQQENFKETIFLEIWTNGSISPSEALLSAGRFLQKLIQPLFECDFQTVRVELSEKEKKVNRTPIEKLSLSARAYNGLKRTQIHCIGDLTKYSIKELKQIKNFGKKSIQEVIYILQKTFDITLK